MAMPTAKEILSMGPIIPIVTLEKAEDALPLADALAAGGIKTMEVTLRTPVGVEAIKLLASERKDMVVGAGTITTPDGFDKVKRAGAQFAVTPGITEMLLAAGKRCGIPFLPGVGTVSDALLTIQHGFTFLRFSPAELSGGVGMLMNFGALFGNLRFCPTGGVNQNNIKNYLALPNVMCVGGSWIVPLKAIREKQWNEITKLVKEAQALVAVRN